MRGRAKYTCGAAHASLMALGTALGWEDLIEVTVFLVVLLGLIALVWRKIGQQNIIRRVLFLSLVFGLASSVDRLNARIDESLQALDQEMRVRVEGLSRLVNETRMTVESKLSAMSTPAPANQAQAAVRPLAVCGRAGQPQQAEQAEAGEVSQEPRLCQTQPAWPGDRRSDRPGDLGRDVQSGDC